MVDGEELRTCRGDRGKAQRGGTAGGDTRLGDTRELEDADAARAPDQ